MTETTPRLGHGPIKMVRVEPWTKNGAHGRPRPGDFFWLIEDGKRSCIIAMPCKGGLAADYGFYIEWPIDHVNAWNAKWAWDGNEDAPTLTPSLHWVGAWHGWVKGGELTEA